MRYLVPALLMLFTAGAVLAHATLAKDSQDAGFIPLFDGATLDGWVGATDGYRVEDGKLVCLPGGSANLLTEKQYQDFVLRFEFNLTPGANNGLAIRSPRKATGNLHLEGIELQILDNRAEKYKDLKKYQYHGSVYGVVPAKRGFQKPPGEWNEQEVTVRGRHIQVVLNGTVIVDANLDQASQNGTLDGAEHPGLARPRGQIGFLGHGDRIEVRNIRIKPLEAN